MGLNILLGKLLIWTLSIYSWIIIIQVVVSWLIVFGVFNLNNPQAKNLMGLLEKATDPVYRPLRKFIPPIGGIDITPLIVIFGIMFLQRIVASVFFF